VAGAVTGGAAGTTPGLVVTVGMVQVRHQAAARGLGSSGRSGGSSGGMREEGKAGEMKCQGMPERRMSPPGCGEGKAGGLPYPFEIFMPARGCECVAG